MSISKRLFFLTCLALGVLASGSGLASAAGKPMSVEISNTHEINGYTVLELTAKVNPNGASTSTVIELREEGSSTWTAGATHNLSGTTVRSYSEEFQVKPVQNYELRVTAKNLYGTTQSSIGKDSTRIITTGEKELTNVPAYSEGVANFAFTFAAVDVFVTCPAFSSGRIGNPGGKGDTYKFTMPGCTSYYEGEEDPLCKIKETIFTLAGPTLAVEYVKAIHLIPSYPECAPGGDWQIYPKPFRVVDNGSGVEYGKTRSVTMTAPATLYTGNPAEVTIESTWGLNAEWIGTPFKIATVGL
jgi:hypothetical protein